MLKSLKICVIIGVLILNCISIFFLISLFLDFEHSTTTFVIRITAFVIAITLLALVLFKLLSTRESCQSTNNVIRGLNVASVIIFFAYFICFAVQTSGIERGSDLYMHMMYPGIIPLISGTLLLGISSKR